MSALSGIHVSAYDQAEFLQLLLDYIEGNEIPKHIKKELVILRAKKAISDLNGVVKFIEEK